MEFRNAYRNISRQLNYHGTDLTYKQWLRKDDDLKAAYLFVNFYPEIRKAYYKAKFSYVEDVDSLHILFQYLQKNVEKIKKDKERYDPRYIYSVSHNCMRDLRWIKRDSDRDKFEVPWTVCCESGEVELTQLLGIGDVDVKIGDDTYHVSSVFDVTHIMGPEYEKLSYCMISSGMSLLRSKSNGKDLHTNPFADVHVRKRETERMIKEMRAVLRRYIELQREDLRGYLD